MKGPDEKLKKYVRKIQKRITEIDNTLVKKGGIHKSFNCMKQALCMAAEGCTDQEKLEYFQHVFDHVNGIEKQTSEIFRILKLTVELLDETVNGEFWEG